MFANLIAGFINVLQPFNFLMAVFGTVAGVVIGALPGLSGSTGIILLLPLVYKIDASAALLLLCGLFCGSMYGGSISAILLNTPGTPSATATLLDGYPMTQNGDAGRALGISAVSSFIGGLVSAICLALIAPQLAKVALSFTSPDFFALSIFGLSIMASTGKDTVKGLIAGFIGLLISTVGVDQVAGIDRFTFGNVRLMRGLQLLPVLIGVFALSEVFTIVQKGGEREGAAASQRVGRVIPTKADFSALLVSAIVGGLIGVFIGIIPGTGGAISCFLAYQVAKKISKRGEQFGTGVPEGIAAPEASNNGTTGGALIPMLTLAVPGDAVTAIILSVFIVHGMQPGPLFIKTQPDMFASVLAGGFLGCVFLLILGLLVAPKLSKLILVPKRILLPIVTVLCIIGSFACNNRIFDVILMFIFGLIGYFMRKHDYPTAPMVLAIVLGSMMDSNFRRTVSLLESEEHKIAYLFSSPITVILFAVTVLTLIFSIPAVQRLFKKKK